MALPWLARTAITQAIKLARRDQRELSLEARADDDGEFNLPHTGPGPHEQLEFQERLALVHTLPARQQRLLWMRAIGLSYDEIASDAGTHAPDSGAPDSPRTKAAASRCVVDGEQGGP